MLKLLHAVAPPLVTSRAGHIVLCRLELVVEVLPHFLHVRELVDHTLESANRYALLHRQGLPIHIHGDSEQLVPGGGFHIGVDPAVLVVLVVAPVQSIAALGCVHLYVFDGKAAEVIRKSNVHLLQLQTVSSGQQNVLPPSNLLPANQQ